MTKSIYILLALFFLQTTTFSGQEAGTGIKSGQHSTGLEIPSTKPGDDIISHAGYSLLFNGSYKQAVWVAYELTKAETETTFRRTNKFMSDPLVSAGTATDADYAGSGYDKGHLAPAADMGWSKTTMAESFYYSNMSPQLPGFNRGIWKKLEGLIRNWAIENDTLYIVTGPVLAKGLKTIGPGKVSVPAYFYKVVLDYTQPGINGIGFIIPNTSSGESLQHFAVTIDSVEKLTGINFYPALPDIQENKIEKTLCFDCWTWKSAQTGNKAAGDSKASVSVQCKGTTKAGAACRNRTLSPSGFCYLHENQGHTDATTLKPDRRTASVQCSATTKAGNRCKRISYSQNGRCFQHGSD